MNGNIESASETVVTDCINITSEDEVLVLCNDETYTVGKGIYEASKNITDQTYLINYPTGETHGEEPPDFIAEKMSNCDVMIGPTQKSLTHTDARRNGTQKGVRGATLPGIEAENFVIGMNTDYDVVKQRCDKLYNLVSDKQTIRVTTPIGTDIKFEIEKDWHKDTGIARESGGFTNLPAGEVYTTPETADGVIYIDGTVRPHGVLDHTIQIDIEDGSVTEIHDEEMAEQFKQLEEEHGEDVYNLAEIAFGTNDGVENLTGSVLLDEKSHGTAHFAIGDDSSMGGNVAVPIHEDAVFKNPSIYVEGEEIEVPE